MEKFSVKVIWIIIAVVTMVSCKAQLIDSTLPQTDYDIQLKNKSISIDDLGYLYIISDRNELIRYDSNLKQEYAYSNERLGAISSLDVNNPLKLLLFYENYQTIIVLDNLLGEVSRYNLFDLGYNDINAVGISNDNNVWIYDPIDYKLKKLDNSGKLISESITLYNEGLEYIRPTYLAEKGNKVFLYDRDYGFYLFDNLGQYLNHIELQDINSYQVINQNNILFVKDDVMHTYDLTYKSYDVFKPVGDYINGEIEEILIDKKFIYLRDKFGIKKKPL